MTSFRVPRTLPASRSALVLLLASLGCTFFEDHNGDLFADVALEKPACGEARGCAPEAAPCSAGACSECWVDADCTSAPALEPETIPSEPGGLEPEPPPAEPTLEESESEPATAELEPPESTPPESEPARPESAPADSSLPDAGIAPDAGPQPGPGPGPRPKPPPGPGGPPPPPPK